MPECEQVYKFSFDYNSCVYRTNENDTRFNQIIKNISTMADSRRSNILKIFAGIYEERMKYNANMYISKRLRKVYYILMSFFFPETKIPKQRKCMKISYNF